MHLKFGIIAERLGKLGQPGRKMKVGEEFLSKFGNDMEREIRKNGDSHWAI